MVVRRLKYFSKATLGVYILFLLLVYRNDYYRKYAKGKYYCFHKEAKEACELLVEIGNEKVLENSDEVVREVYEKYAEIGSRLVIRPTEYYACDRRIQELKEGLVHKTEKQGARYYCKAFSIRNKVFKYRRAEKEFLAYSGDYFRCKDGEKKLHEGHCFCR